MQGHAGKLVFGTLGKDNHSVVLMVGRLQLVPSPSSWTVEFGWLMFDDSFYEGHSIYDVAFPIRVLKLLGVKRLLGNWGSLNRCEPIF